MDNRAMVTQKHDAILHWIIGHNSQGIFIYKVKIATMGLNDGKHYLRNICKLLSYV